MYGKNIPVFDTNPIGGDDGLAPVSPGSDRLEGQSEQTPKLADGVIKADRYLPPVEIFLDRVTRLNDLYRRGEIHVSVPEGLLDVSRPLDDLVRDNLPQSFRDLQGAERGLFSSLPVSFDPSRSVGPYLATVDRTRAGRVRFLDMGALIATEPFGQNFPPTVQAICDNLGEVVGRFAHSEYQTHLSLLAKEEVVKIAPQGTPRFFFVNTGAEAVENAIKATLLHRLKTDEVRGGGFIISFDGAFHGRTLGSLAVTWRPKARLGFPTFDWPHVPFPVLEPQRKADTEKREEQSLEQIWGLIISGRQPGGDKSPSKFRNELRAIDTFLKTPGLDAEQFVAEQRSKIPEDIWDRSRRAAAVLIEPIQGEGGVRMTSARFMQRLRLLTRIYDVPLIFDEVQTGIGTTGKMWAHEYFKLPLPPDAVVAAKKAQNGILFVSDELAAFFQEEKKFNTTWEGDSVGMIRLLTTLKNLDLNQINETGQIAREGLSRFMKDNPEIITAVRGLGVMLAFDVARSDLRDALRDVAFRRGLILLPAGERTLRFYPRYDTEPYAIQEALDILANSAKDIKEGRFSTGAKQGPKFRFGVHECPIETIQVLQLTSQTFAKLSADIENVEMERYGDLAQSSDSARTSVLALPIESLERTISNSGSIGIALKDGITKQVVAYALGSPLENHHEEGVLKDPHHGENNTFFLQALAIDPSVQNQKEVQSLLLNLISAQARAEGFGHISALIENRIVSEYEPWEASFKEIETHPNYLGSGIPFTYVSVSLKRSTGPKS